MNGEKQTQAITARTYTADDAHELGLPSPDALNLLDSFAKKMQGSVFLPKALSNHPANILGVILTGREMGFSPMQALRMFWVSPDGRVAMYADAMMAAMRTKGFKFPGQDFTKQRAYLKAVRPDGEEYEAEFTWDDAQAAGLAGKDTYKRYPKDMLKARAIGSVWRFLGADLGGSQIYTREEIEDVEYVQEAEPDVAKQFAVGRKAEAETAAPAAEMPLPPPETKTPEPEPPAPADDLKDRAKARLDAAKLIIGGPERAAQSMINSFLKEYLGVVALPKGDLQALLPAIGALEAELKNDLPGFLASPKEAGERARNPQAAPDGLTQLCKTSAWPESIERTLRDIMQAREMGPDYMVTWLLGLKLPDLLLIDVQAFLKVACLTSRPAALLDAAEKYKISPHNIVASMEQDAGKPIGELSKEQIDKLLGALDAQLRQGNPDQADDGQEEMLF